MSDGGETFWCPGCERHRDVDEGAHDDMPELCDDCWYAVTQTRERELSAAGTKEAK